MLKFEDYFIPGTKVLKNKLGITDLDELIKMESKISLERLTNLCASDYEFIPSADYFCSIHKYLFESIYEFAGVYREVEIFKETGFLKPELIKEELRKIKF